MSLHLGAFSPSQLQPLARLHEGARLIGAAVNAWFADRCSSMSASVAFYAAFSLAPMLLIIITVASFFFGADAVQGHLYAEIASLVGEDGAMALQAMVASAWKSEQGGWVGLVSLAAIVIGASATFAELHSALDAIWKVPPPERAVAALIRVRLTSFGLVVGTGFLIVILLVADAVLSYVTEFIFVGKLVLPLLGIVQHLVSLAFLSVAFAILLHVLPDTRVYWRAAAWGGVAAALLFSGGKRLFAFYLAHASTANSFGAASSLAVLMMWLFFSAAVFFFGAEIAVALERRRRERGERPALTR